MPFFKSTYNILKKPDEDEVHNNNWFDTPFLQLPPSYPWDYKREMQIEDVDIWEVLVESGPQGIYASWCPYAEFYLVVTGGDYRNQWHGTLNKITYNYNDKFWETYYGAGAQIKVRQKAKELNLPLNNFNIWVEEEKMWLYQEPKEFKTLIIN
jgi:hypothetical protein